MKAKRILSALLALMMMLSLAACSGKTETNTPAANAPAAGTSSGSSDTPNEESPSVEDSAFYGPIYDEWSDMTDEELYQQALEEVKDGSEITVYATSSKMLKAEDKFEEAFPGLNLTVMDMDQDEVLEK